MALVASAIGCSAGGTSSSDLGPSQGGTGNQSTGGATTNPAGGTSPMGGNGGTIIVMMEGGDVDPCVAAGLEPGCETMIPPACGDAELNQDTEECDDGNGLPGDCCSGNCKVEAYCVCPPGDKCHTTIVCGDGMRGPGEACDDGNTNSGDGCTANCRGVELGYSCPPAGGACTHHYTCGDGITDPNEGCDDKNAMSGDGCSEHCRIELGFKCDGSPSVCSATTCGDKIKEGAESCDDGNAVGFDGCSPDCRAEPACPTGEACESSCGDGIVFGAEACDDGNLRDGDGCSSTCQQEEGYVCDNEPPCVTMPGVNPTTLATEDICVITVPAIYRDFNSGSGGHPDFQPGYTSDGATQGLVEDLLDADGKPVLTSKIAAATLLSSAFLHGKADFAEWYRDAPPSSGPIAGRIVLWDNQKGGYVNRWGAAGEQWTGKLAQMDYEPVTYGGPGGGGCTACTVSATGMCYDPCTPWGAGSTDACCGEVPTGNGYDGNPLFFPLDGAKGTLGGARSEGKVPAQYGWTGWPDETDVATELGVNPAIMTSTAPFPSTMHNYSFTTEVKYWFKYAADTDAALDFTGDDDVWVFLNGHLAVDMGGWHVPTNGSLTINGATIRVVTQTNADDTGVGPTTMKNGTAATYGLEAGNVYQIQVFHAERQTEGSSFKLTLAGFNMTPSDCRTNCGDGMVGPGEECDDGMNLGEYNGCGAGCVNGPRCGDGVPQEQEACDDGVNAGTYGGCGPDCQPGPHCGDGVVSPEEECDDGAMAGAYGGCTNLCKIGPHCGDGSVAVSIDPSTGVAYEQCDDANTTTGDGCSNCKLDVPITK